MELTDNEVKALTKLINDTAKGEGEDVIGLFMKHGLFQFFETDTELVELARKFYEK